MFEFYLTLDKYISAFLNFTKYCPSYIERKTKEVVEIRTSLPYLVSL